MGGLQLQDLSGSDSQPSSALENPTGAILFFRGGGGRRKANDVAAGTRRNPRGGADGVVWTQPRRLAAPQRLDLAPSFRMDSSAAGTVVQSEHTVRLVDSLNELSTRRFAARRAIASLPSSQQRERDAQK